MALPIAGTPAAPAMATSGSTTGIGPSLSAIPMRSVAPTPRATVPTADACRSLSLRRQVIGAGLPEELHRRLR